MIMPKALGLEAASMSLKRFNFLAIGDTFCETINFNGLENIEFTTEATEITEIIM